MNRNYRGAYERGVDRMISEGTEEICINWINMSAKEAGSGGADRITRKLIEAGYRPDGAACASRVREAYEAGQKVNGRYIRLPQEAWRKIA
ncbi:MAG: hypothetical protein Q4C66_05275 [Lachnospiraceae bacterium]|nr:hypothetical protein [Lachnospiraceae bacterium]